MSLEMDVLEPGLDLVVQSQESLQVETALCVDPQGVDLHASRGPVVGGCDRQTVTHCVQQMAGRADMLAAPKKSHRLIARQAGEASLSPHPHHCACDP